MDTKRRNWQWLLILGVLGLTLYNILPTLFYYSNDLHRPVSKEEAQQIGQEIAERVDGLEQDSVDWLHSYCKRIGVSPSSIALDPIHRHWILLTFAKTEEATTLRKMLLRAGALIPFAPAQLSVLPPTDHPKEVLVQRKLGGSLKEFAEYRERGLAEMEARRLGVERALGVPSEFARIWAALNAGGDAMYRRDWLLSAARIVGEISKVREERPALAKRMALNTGLGEGAPQLSQMFTALRDELKQGKEPSEREATKLAVAEQWLKGHAALFAGERGAHPLFKAVTLQPDEHQLALSLHGDVAGPFASKEVEQIVRQWVSDAAAALTQETQERLAPSAGGYQIPLHSLSGTTGFLALRLDLVGEKLASDLLASLKNDWHPQHPDLAALPVLSWAEYQKAPAATRALCLVVTAPIGEPHPYLRPQSIYAMAVGFERILKAYETTPDAALAQMFTKDFQALAQLLYQHGMVRSFVPEMGPQFLFEKRDFYLPLLAATREEFHPLPHQGIALLELSDVEQRIVAKNKIETAMQESLLQWNDEFHAAEVSLDPSVRYDFAPPSKSVFWSNVKLSLAKLWRGDERKILRWGLDLSGGKTVQIELRDAKNRVVEDEEDLKQGINELFARVNKMGVSDVAIRQAGHHIVLDFPGGQALSAHDLVQASSMYFHLVNEEFGPGNRALAEPAHRFLTEVWNEALIAQTEDPAAIQAIAYRRLHEEEGSESAKALREKGLKLAHPEKEMTSAAFDVSLSKVAVLREHEGRAHPLLLVFANHALEGTHLAQIQSNYDPTRGNSLSFEVGLSSQGDFAAWTTPFSKERLSGTPREAYTPGHGWRMAVLLNDRVISAPSLESPLRESATISGHFSVREVNQLVADLRAGSLSFTPHILSEKNVSPELGKSDRMKGIEAAFAATLLVILSMIAYYRFAGVVASVAVLFNLLILWAVLQNLGASLSLAGIAGVILTVGMAVDANVLVFERIKEELQLGRSFKTALSAGYEKAFSAILDSNVTTIIAALILLQFDAGPIKAFAVSMIIGIASSMFTALFMTRFYFEGWLAKNSGATLKMAHWIRASKIRFLSKTRASFAFSLLLIGVGSVFLWTHQGDLFGMDFTGGRATSVAVAATEKEPVHALESALLAAGLSRSDFQIREHDPETPLRLLLSASLDQPGQPFHALGTEEQIHWVTKALRASSIALVPSFAETVQTNWTAVSGQMSESMRNHALIGLLLSFGAIFIYLALRFEAKYAAAALLCLLHDVWITLASIGLLRALHVPVQIELNTVAALMTIIGYSLNDTIIIFDRIREEAHRATKQSMAEIIELSLNTTLSRTAITSGTTLIAVLALLLFGGASLFTFSLVMAIGILFGTLSSWFIAAPLLLFFHRKGESESSPLYKLQ